MAKETFYSVHMKTYGKESLGKVLVKTPEALIGKAIKINLSNLARGKLGEANGRITEVKEDQEMAVAIPTGIKLYPSYIKRFVRRGSTKIDDSFLVDIKDGQIRAKPVLITRKRVKNSVATALIKETREEVKKLLSTMTLEEIILDLLKGEIQKKMGKKLKKIYPLSFFEIREIKVIKKKTRR